MAGATSWNRPGKGREFPTIDMLAALSARLQAMGIRSQPTLELPYLDWIKLHTAIEDETNTAHHVGGVVDPLITRGCWFYAAGVKIRSCG